MNKIVNLDTASTLDSSIVLAVVVPSTSRYVSYFYPIQILVSLSLIEDSINNLSTSVPIHTHDITE